MVWERDPQQRLPGQETVGSPRSPGEGRAEREDGGKRATPATGNASHRHLQSRHSETSRNANQAHLPACPHRELPESFSHVAARAPSWLQGERREKLMHLHQP